MYRIDNPRQTVCEVQKYLLEVAYADGFPKPTIDGIYDETTRDAVTSFQEKYGLRKTGIVDCETWRVLYARFCELTHGKEIKESAFASSFPLSVGDTGYNVTLLQALLCEHARYYPNVTPPAVTGQYGYATEAAVTAMQHNYREEETGIASRDFYLRLSEDRERKARA